MLLLETLKVKQGSKKLSVAKKKKRALVLKESSQWQNAARTLLPPSGLPFTS
jgi:hypothetical protein